MNCANWSFGDLWLLADRILISKPLQYAMMLIKPSNQLTRRFHDVVNTVLVDR